MAGKFTHSRSTDRPDIAILLPDLRGGGAERTRLALAQEFLASGLSVEFVLLRARGELLGSVPLGCSLSDLGVDRIRSALLPLAAYLRNRAPHALLAGLWPITGLAVLARSLAGQETRLVLSEHNALSHTPAYRGPSRWVHRTFGRAFYRHAEAVVAVSAGVRDELCGLTGLGRDEVAVIYNGLAPRNDGEGPDPDIMRWWLEGDERLIAIGHLKQQKDYPTMFRALALLGPNARLLVLGEGRERSRLVRLAGQLGIAHRVRLAGFVHNPGAYLGHANVFVISSLWEGLANVLLEALQAGLPIVATDCPHGPSEILLGRYGRLVPMADPAQLASAIRLSLSEPGDPEKLRARAAEFSIATAARRYRELLLPESNDS